MLSTLSPIKLNQSTICDGPTPVLARTCPSVQTAPLLSPGFNSPTRADTNCIKSLSALAITTAMPASAARRARHAM